uniref:DUF2834 domain-containing protein n=1 Tax=Cyanothece sp. (strain PCC 7425 / ATCC 29141) TaxID=395961 RepID=B8HKG7_CYAP4
MSNMIAQQTRDASQETWSWLRRLVLWVIWIGFVAYTLYLAPLDRPSTWEFGRQLLSLQWQAINAYLLAIFCLMGVWPLIYACLMFADGRMQPVRAWPCFVGANFAGIICLLPYLLFRRRNGLFQGEKDWWLEILDQRITGILLLLATIGLMAYALAVGDWPSFVQQFHTKAFTHLITLDFCLMGLIFPITTLFDDDMARRGIHNSKVFWSVALVPLFGPLLYLCFRPSLKQSRVENPSL